ncbi:MULTISPECIES: SDR family NAD(P)-dependent oxidoreductase [Streptomycetaceae]|uniref:Short-chain dehydrogenase/reductase SDR n=1 Tax=Streptantibioticus cattleyicolor (strain ATCC 35852 / DSM 46488 / JCM 4925 / NBRC 14057 / NRRL 8057) TaxID=1003195 RepID=F8JSZ9_STREN|nr:MULTISPECIES: SDR family NAD(P)-dependent oxidoreductase [Streptomycetaceae]AEW98075.1 short-chain dehydrogenase/reductase SDR [Streptantibioticus cattleyicolor NRRL 8057 = DSM 46488]MYS62469.1 SDR family NAD(P)-dependent oxidoreductase [Streptomyces sp. SID5468]CCB78391.1 Short-chain alcohol dehydrogenase [Streptantibioticus cattleyicolor NRRL 8057 = DSM 46488]
MRTDDEQEAVGVRSVLVTGAASGIGAAVARHYGRAPGGLGAGVLVADVDVAGGEAVAAEVGGRFVRTDVSCEDDNTAAVRAAVEEFGGLDLVHLNAGVGDGGGFGDDDYRPEQLRRVVSVNLLGVMYGLRAALPALAAHGGGAVVVTSSMAGLALADFDPVYAATKHAVIGLVRSLAPVWEKAGVRINAVCPGFVSTPILPAEAVEYIRSAGYALAEPAEIAAMVAEVVAGGDTGRAYLAQHGRGPEPVAFPKLELVRADE